MYSLKSIMLLQKSELTMDELVGVAIAVIALKYYVSAMFQVKYIIQYFGAHYNMDGRCTEPHRVNICTVTVNYFEMRMRIHWYMLPISNHLLH